MTKWTTLPADVALQCPAWASDETKSLAAESAELFDATRAARAEVERLKAEAGTIDLMQTSLADLTGAGAMLRQSQLEALRSELVARARFAEFLSALERDRRRVEREALAMIETARNDAKAALLDAGCPDLSEAVNHRGKPDETLRIAFNQVVNSFPPVGAAADTHREARSMGSALTERAQYNRRHREEAEKELRGLLERMAAVAVA